MRHIPQRGVPSASSVSSQYSCHLTAEEHTITPPHILLKGFTVNTGSFTNTTFLPQSTLAVLPTQPFYHSQHWQFYQHNLSTTVNTGSFTNTTFLPQSTLAVLPTQPFYHTTLAVLPTQPNSTSQHWQFYQHNLSTTINTGSFTNTTFLPQSTLAVLPTQPNSTSQHWQFYQHNLFTTQQPPLIAILFPLSSYPPLFFHI